MKDYEQRRPSFSSSLAGLARLGGLTALAEEAGQEVEVDEARLESHRKEISASHDVLPPIGRAHFEPAKPGRVELSDSDSEIFDINNIASTKARSNAPASLISPRYKSYRDEAPATLMTPRKSTTKSLTTKTVQGGIATSKDADNRTPRRFSFSDRRSISHEADKGRHRLTIPSPSSTLTGRHSTETEQIDSRMNGPNQGSNLTYQLRPRAQTWNTARYRRPSDSSMSDAGQIKRNSLSENVAGGLKILIETADGRDQSSSVLDENEDFDVRPSNRRGRRWSRPDFAETSRRVSLLLQAAQAGRIKGERRMSLPARNLPDEDFPKRPRFSSFMSAEAQFALLQGYEDRLVEWLERKFPGYKGLRRSSTPGEGVGIKRHSLRPEREDFEYDSDDRDSDEESKQDGNSSEEDDLEEENMFSFKRRSFPNLSFRQTSLERRDSLVPEDAKDSDPKVALKSLRRLSNPFLRKEFSIHTLFGDETNQEEGINGDSIPQHMSPFLRRHGSLPTVSYDLPSDRRLAMTGRLENAMDILDTLRAEQGEKAVLSPRAKVRKGRVAPLPDYNVWVSQWGSEFKIFKGKTSSLA